MRGLANWREVAGDAAGAAAGLRRSGTRPAASVRDRPAGDTIDRDGHGL
jgi:hypothetical protein